MHPSLTIRRRHPSRYILGAWRYHRYRHRAGQGVAWPDVLCGVEHDAIEQGVEADEAWSTSELRSLTPVLGRQLGGAREAR